MTFAFMSVTKFCRQDKSRLYNQLAAVAVDLPNFEGGGWGLLRMTMMPTITRFLSNCVRVHGLCNRQLALSLLSSSLANYGALKWPLNVCPGVPFTPALTLQLSCGRPLVFHSSWTDLRLAEGRVGNGWPLNSTSDDVFCCFFCLCFFWTPMNHLVKMLKLQIKDRPKKLLCNGTVAAPNNTSQLTPARTCLWVQLWEC